MKNNYFFPFSSKEFNLICSQRYKFNFSYLPSQYIASPEPLLSDSVVMDSLPPPQVLSLCIALLERRCGVIASPFHSSFLLLLLISEALPLYSMIEGAIVDVRFWARGGQWGFLLMITVLEITLSVIQSEISLTSKPYFLQ